jgi:hypothetical protein
MLAKDALNFVAGLLVNLIIGLTLAVIVMRLRRPRPDWRTLATQPGFVACIAGPLGFLIFLEASYLDATIKPELAIAGTVAVAWVVLAVSRRWAAEPSWIDRLGRFLGVSWIVAALCLVVERSI